MTRFAFIGGTVRGYRLLQSLINENRIPLFAVILREDDHESVKYSSDISSLLSSHKIAVSVKKELNNDDYEMIRKSSPDIVIVSGWRTLIDPKANQYVKEGFIAAHYSLLPKYRGFAPVQWAIINGEKETGVTLFKINEGEADSGLIAAQKKIEIAQNDYSKDLDDKIISCTVELFQEFIQKYESGTLKYTKQDESKATYSCKRIPEDGKIDWRKSSSEIFNLIRALAYPYPGAFCEYNNVCYHIRSAQPGKHNDKIFSGRIPGRVTGIYKEGIEVLCGKGTIMITEWEDKSEGIVNCPSEVVKSITSTLK